MARMGAVRHHALVLVVAVLAAALVPTPAHAQIRDRSALVAALDSAVRAHVANDAVPGVSVAVVRGADTLLLGGYGYVDLEWNVPTPADASASYEIGSVTKQFTAAAILQLVDQGRLELDADFTLYLPDFDTRGHTVPLRRLLDHTSGIKGYTEMEVFADISLKDLPRDTLVSLIEAEPFEFEPGTAQIYNNSAFFLLGLIIEKASGQPYDAYVQEHLFDPAGMTSSYYCSEDAIREKRAHGYDEAPDGLRRKAYLDQRWPFSAGSLCSTAGDLVRWNRALHGGRILPEAVYHEMTTPRPLLDGTELSYAMGLAIDDRAGHRVISHGGGINGFLSDARYFPEDDLTVVVLQNSAVPVGPGLLTHALLDLILGPVPELVAVPYAGNLDRLLGTYAGPVRGSHMHMIVTREGDHLVLTPAGQDNGQRPVHTGGGTWEAPGTRVTFDMAGDRVIALRIAQGSGRYRLTRMPEGHP
jgi:CubicO group peptidase (beta-lactamase class C family)